ncbi:MAG: LamG-like jellyroll fold domain-containing protein [Rubripirellula sp.]
MNPLSAPRILCLVLCLSSSLAVAQERVTNGLQVLYDFSGSGDRVKDRSGVGKALDLRIDNIRAVKRDPNQLKIHSQTIIRSEQPAKKLSDSIGRSGSVSIEAWLATAKEKQAGPARIVTMSEHTSKRNFTLGQDNASFDVRFRTQQTDANGLPSLSAAGVVVNKVTHVVYTRNRGGQAKLYIDGKQVSDRQVSGDLSNWQANDHLAIANEMTGERPWLGTLHLVAIYSRALDAKDVKRNFAAGPGAKIEVVQARKTVAAPASAGNGARVGRGLAAFYDFQGTDGDMVRDRSGVGAPIDLKIDKLNQVHREPGVLKITGDTAIRSAKSPKRLIEAMRRSNALSIEAWLRPDSLSQKGPARIVTLSKDSNQRNFTLGQEGSQFETRLRTTETSINGIPSIRSASKSVQKKLMHVVYTRDRRGNARIYVDGKPGKQESVSGSFQNWAGDYPLALANELAGGRQWRGELHLVAIYSRDLSNLEVKQNFLAGPRGTTGDATELVSQPDEKAVFFETKVAPLLSQHCLECHDSASSEGGLDLARKAAALRGGDSGVALVAGKSADSLLWQSIEEDSMPHDRPALNAEQKQVIKKWIDDGAAWPIDFVDPAIYRSVGRTENWVQRLTIPEYIATVRATVDVDISEDANKILPQDKRADGFRNTAYNLNVDLKHIEAYSRLAEMIVEKMDPQAFAKRFSNKRLLTDDSMRDVIGQMGKWVLRGPLDEHEVVVYRGISTTVASAGGDFGEAVKLVLQAMLQSPRFIYRIENHRGDGSQWPVNEYELASRISYIVWGASPDQELLSAAEAGELADPQALRQQVSRMLKDPRAIERSKQFVVEWLNLDRLSNMQPNVERFPNWNPDLASDMRAETIEFFLDLVWKQKQPLPKLLNAQFTYATPTLAKHYGIPSDGKDLKRYDLSKIDSRGGLLTHGSVLTIGGDDASMVTRGLFVLNDLLFSEVGDPPPGLDITPVPTSPGRTHRAIAIERVESESCGGCHKRFEPLAYGLEKFDGLGSFHDVDQHGNSLREDGEILFPGDAKPIRYQTTAELMDLLAESDRVSQCITRKLTQFSLGRPLIASDAASIRKIQEVAKKRGGTYEGVLTEIILSDLVQSTRTEDE